MLYTIFLQTVFGLENCFLYPLLISLVSYSRLKQSLNEKNKSPHIAVATKVLNSQAF